MQLNKSHPDCITLVGRIPPPHGGVTVHLDQMGQVSRKRAEKMLSPDVFVNKYIELIEQVTANRKRL